METKNGTKSNELFHKVIGSYLKKPRRPQLVCAYRESIWETKPPTCGHTNRCHFANKLR